MFPYRVRLIRQQGACGEESEACWEAMCVCLCVCECVSVSCVCVCVHVCVCLHTHTCSHSRHYLCLPADYFLHHVRPSRPYPCVHHARGSRISLFPFLSLSLSLSPCISQARPLGSSMAKITAEIPPADDADVAGTHSQKCSVTSVRFFFGILHDDANVAGTQHAGTQHILKKYSLFDVM